MVQGTMDVWSVFPARRNGCDRTAAGWIPEMIDRIVREYRPLMIVQFDSPAAPDGGVGSGRSKGDARDSVALLVVVPDSWRSGGQRNPAWEIVERLQDIPIDKDVVISTPKQIALHGNIPGTALNLALREGLAADVAEDLRHGRRPAAMKDDEAAVYDFCVELMQDRRVSDPVLERLRAQLTDQQVVDLVAVAGFYATVSMILNTVDAALPDGERLPLPPLTSRL